MARQKKTIVDIDRIYRKAMEGYTQMTAPRSEADFSGHDYAYRCGQAKELFRQILKELGVEICEEGENE